MSSNGAAGWRLYWGFSFGIFAPFPCLTIEDFGAGLHVVVRFGPWSIGIARSVSPEEARKRLIERLHDLSERL